MIDHFTIDRTVWLRGADARNGSLLLRETDRKRCCLGIYLSACGVEDRLIEGFASPAFLFRERPEVRDLIPKWLLARFPWHQVGNDPLDAVNSQLATTMMEVNDDADRPEEEREAFVKAAFAEQGVEVDFV